jgi:hypothetical protein
MPHLTRQAGEKAKSPLYAGLLAFLAGCLGLAAAFGSGGVFKNTRAMSSMVGALGACRFAGFAVAMAGV